MKRNQTVELQLDLPSDNLRILEIIRKMLKRVSESSSREPSLMPKSDFGGRKGRKTAERGGK